MPIGHSGTCAEPKIDHKKYNDDDARDVGVISCLDSLLIYRLYSKIVNQRKSLERVFVILIIRNNNSRSPSVKLPISSTVRKVTY